MIHSHALVRAEIFRPGIGVFVLLLRYGLSDVQAISNIKQQYLRGQVVCAKVDWVPYLLLDKIDISSVAFRSPPELGVRSHSCGAAGKITTK